MGKGSDSGGSSQAPSAPTSSNVTSTSLPTYAEPFVTRLMTRGEAASQTPYQAYTGQRLADFGADTSAAFQGYRDIANAGQPAGIATATNRMTEATQFDPTAITSGYTPGAISTGQFGTEEAAQYMNPYIQNALNVQKTRAQEKFGEDQSTRNAAAVQAGAFGGNRRGVVDAMAQRDLNRQLQEIEAQGMSQAYGQAGQMFTADQARSLQTQQAREQAAATAGQMGQQAQIETEKARISAEGIGTQAASELGALGQLGQQLGLQRQEALGKVGAIQDERAQAAAEMQFSDFVNQRDYDRQQINFLQGVLRGVPISAQQEVTQYQAPATAANQLLGLGVGGLGLYKALNPTK